MGKRARILVVDDDESVRKTLAAILETQGYKVDTASNGRQAIRKSSSCFFNLAFIDIRLPDMEGTTLLAKMRSTTPRMRRIVSTGYPLLQNTIEAANGDADDYIVKPFNPIEVLQKIKEQLKKQAEEAGYSQGKVAGFIETRVRELQMEEADTYKREKQ